MGRGGSPVRVEVVGVPLDLGADRRGTDLGPGALRAARLREVLVGLGHEVADVGDLVVPTSGDRPEPGVRLHYLPEIAAACRQLAGTVRDVLARGALPLVLGGDHSLSIGVLAGRCLAGCRGGVIWLDAHGDFNTEETTPSGNIHGMSLAVATGRGAPELLAVAGGASVAEGRTAIVGVRRLDPGEQAALRASGVRVFTMRDVDQAGIGVLLPRAIEVASGGGAYPFHLSLDLDVLDPLHAPGVGTAVGGGLTCREAHLVMQLAADSGLLGSLDVVELNPVLDEHNRTAALAVELIASALGWRIY